jgi:hypothetical protein
MEVPFIFIHIGEIFFPEYVSIAIEQCRKWNPKNPIIFIRSKVFNNILFSSNITYIDIESINKTDKHIIFENTSRLDTTFRNGFWKYTTERLFFLEDYCIQNSINELFHLENDNMVYFNAEQLINVFRDTTNGITSPALAEDENTFGLLYSNNLNIFSLFTETLLYNNNNMNEMSLGSIFFKNNNCSFLPSIPCIYDIEDNKKQFISNNIDKYNGIFDPAQYGQWLGGIDPRNGESKPYAFSNTRAIIEANNFEYYIKDNRYYIKKDNITYPIYLLHIHSKHLNNFVLL